MFVFSRSKTDLLINLQLYHDVNKSDQHCKMFTKGANKNSVNFMDYKQKRSGTF